MPCPKLMALSPIACFRTLLISAMPCDTEILPVAMPCVRSRTIICVLDATAFSPWLLLTPMSCAISFHEEFQSSFRLLEALVHVREPLVGQRVHLIERLVPNVLDLQGGLGERKHGILSAVDAVDGNTPRFFQFLHQTSKRSGGELRELAEVLDDSSSPGWNPG